MSVQARRWRGPRRPDVQALAGTQLAADGSAPQQQQQTSEAAQTDAASSEQDGEQELKQTLRSLYAARENPAVPHFKYNFLSAGRVDPRAQEDSSSLRVNSRPSIIDATRSFSAEPSVAFNDSAKMARAAEEAHLERHAAGLGYGTGHRDHFGYLSRSLPPRQVESVFDERPCAFPTVSLAPRPGPTLAQVHAMPFEEQEEHSREFKRKVASGLGFGPHKTPNHRSYIANSYWKQE